MPSTTYIPAHARPPYYASPPPPSPTAGPSRARSPQYAPPDTDPSLPLPRSMSSSDSEDSNGGGQHLEYSQAQYDADQAREDPNELHPGYEEPYDPSAAAGPSRKRARTDEFANGNGNGSSNGGSDSFQPKSSSFVPRSRPPDPPPAQAEDYGAHEQDDSAAGAGYEPPGGVVQGEGHDVPIAPSIFGIAPRNEFTKTIGEFIMANARGRENVEVEIKLGTLMGADGGQGPPRRMRMPAMSEMSRSLFTTSQGEKEELSASLTSRLPHRPLQRKHDQRAKPIPQHASQLCDTISCLYSLAHPLFPCPT